MSLLVVDSSVVIKWFVPEVHSDAALRYLDPDLERHAPKLLLAELGNILWKKVGRGELTAVEADRIASQMGQADVTIHPMISLLISRFSDSLQCTPRAFHRSHRWIFLSTKVVDHRGVVRRATFSIL